MKHPYDTITVHCYSIAGYLLTLDVLSEAWATHNWRMYDAELDLIAG